GGPRSPGRGAPFPGGFSAAASAPAAPAAVPAELVTACIRSGLSATPTSHMIGRLASEAARGSVVGKLSLVAAVVLLVGGLTAGLAPPSPQKPLPPPIEIPPGVPAAAPPPGPPAPPVRGKGRGRVPKRPDR